MSVRIQKTKQNQCIDPKTGEYGLKYKDDRGNLLAIVPSTDRRTNLVIRFYEQGESMTTPASKFIGEIYPLCKEDTYVIKGLAK